MSQRTQRGDLRLAMVVVCLASGLEVNLSANRAPTVSLSSPSSGATFARGATITISASAADSDGWVTRVQFYVGSTLIGTDTSRPFGRSWSAANAGSYTLRAVATDNAGARTWSAARTVTVTAYGSGSQLSVSLTSPSSGAVFIAPATISLSASASSTSGYITRVDFYRGSTLIRSDTSSPYTYSWTNVPVGSYALTAVARTSTGRTIVSSTRDITVRSATMPSTAVFTPPSNHATAVDRYMLELFFAGADTRVANPVATRDLGKPPVSSGQIRVNIGSTILALRPGNYVATVTAFGSGGSSQSAASPTFTR